VKLQDYLLRYMEYCFHETMKQVYRSPEYLMQPDSHALILDCGCNNGEYANYLGKRLGTQTVYGIEINRPLAKQARDNNIRVVRADLNSYWSFQSDSLSVVTAFNLLEHLVETQRFVNELYRVLKPGGYAVINTPNLASWHNIAALLVGLQPFSGPNITSMTESDVPIVRRMHRRAHSLPEDPEYTETDEPERHRHIVVVAYKGIIHALKRVGFSVENALGFGYYPLPPALARVASRLDPSHAHHMVIKACKPG